MDPDAELIPFSPTISSVSSSDLDTESTGSFFPDRSTTLGTLMGVTLPDAASARHSRAPSPQATAAAVAAGRRRRRRKRGGSWWRLCRDDMRPTSLGDVRQMERQLAEVDHGLYGGCRPPEHESVGGGPLFRDGRVLPPAAERRRSAAVGAGSVGRLPVMLTGICSGGEG